MDGDRTEGCPTFGCGVRRTGRRSARPASARPVVVHPAPRPRRRRTRRSPRSAPCSTIRFRAFVATRHMHSGASRASRNGPERSTPRRWASSNTSPPPTRTRAFGATRASRWLPHWDGARRRRDAPNRSVVGDGRTGAPHRSVGLRPPLDLRPPVVAAVSRAEPGSARSPGSPASRPQPTASASAHSSPHRTSAIR